MKTTYKNVEYKLLPTNHIIIKVKNKVSQEKVKDNKDQLKRLYDAHKIGAQTY